MELNDEWEVVNTPSDQNEWEVVSEQPQPRRGLSDVAFDAVGQTPLGMVARGGDAMVQAIPKLLDVTGIPVPQSVQEGAKRIFGPSRAMGIGVAEHMAGHPFGQTYGETTRRTIEALKPGYEPKGPIQAVGSMLGENAPAIAASMIPGVGPAFAGPAVMAAQQAQTGKISPILGIPATYSTTKGIFKATGLDRKVVPPLLKAIKGTPLQVSKMALDDPSILDRPGTSQSVQGKAQNIIDAVNDANRQVGDEYGQTYNRFGMKSPREKIIESGESPTPAFEDLRQSYHDAMSGKLLDGLSDNEKLAKLTDLKRSLQDQTIYPQPGQKLSNSQGSLNSATEKMASDIDALRGKIPGGEQLALSDDAWAEIKELKHRLVNAFKDPYTGQDYLNRILKGNTDWLTSGRNAARVGAIERIEEITGKQVLQPALKEMAAAYLKNPDVLSLPSWRLQSVLAALIPNKIFFGKGSGASRAGTVIAEGAVTPERRNSILKKLPEPRSILKNRGRQPFTVIQAGAKQPRSVGNLAEDINAVQEPLKVLDESTARAFLKQAKGDKTLARRLAKEARYQW
jgi:hypothetical protein